MSLLGFEIDPHKVLGVPTGASLGEIRDAYRQKAKRYHPDAGGEEWAFRILQQAYEMLCTARVVRAAHVEQAPRKREEPPPTPHDDHHAETVHKGLFDKDVAPERIVAVEHLCVRYLWDEVDFLWLTQKAPDEERFLSCSLNLVWPDPLAGPVGESVDRAQITGSLGEIFDQLIVATRVVASRSRTDSEQFVGWLSYSSFDRSWKALNTLHGLLRGRGLGLRHWSRDLFLPRTWR